MPRKSSPSKKAGKPPREQVRAYVAALAPDARRSLRQLRAAVRAVAPRAEESFSYGIPGFKLDGRPLLWCAAWKAHTSLYPMTATMRRALGDDLDGYEMSTGTIRFPLSEPVPTTLVKRIVRARVAELKKKGR
jgi:uncharacterized protein YdhG (YjbR/CyaY superfamily)